jgi:hypothetical protein
MSLELVPLNAAPNDLWQKSDYFDYRHFIFILKMSEA